MHSERRVGLVGLLFSQGLGVFCGLSTAVLLAVGSVILAFGDDGRAIQMDDFRVFFERPALRHFWFYLLVLILGLYALNTFLCTLDNVYRRWRNNNRRVSAYAAAVMHLGFLLALLAHLVGGLFSFESQPAIISQAWSPLTEGAELRVVKVRTENHQNGDTKQVYIDAELRRSNEAKVQAVEISYNHPISSGWGSDLFLLAGLRKREVAEINAGSARCVASIGQPCSLPGRTLQVLGLHHAGHWGKVPMAVVRDLAQPNGSFFLLAEKPHRLADGSELVLKRLSDSPLVILRRRHAPGTPLALLASIMMAVGIVMFGRRWWT